MTVVNRKSEQGNSGKETFEKGQFWKWHIWKRTTPKSNNMKNDSSGKETTENRHFWTGKNEKDSSGKNNYTNNMKSLTTDTLPPEVFKGVFLNYMFWKGTTRKRTIPRMKNLKKDNSEKETIEKRHIWKRQF